MLWFVYFLRVVNRLLSFLKCVAIAAKPPFLRPSGVPRLPYNLILSAAPFLAASFIFQNSGKVSDGTIFSDSDKSAIPTNFSNASFDIKNFPLFQSVRILREKPIFFATASKSPYFIFSRENKRWRSPSVSLMRIPNFIPEYISHASNFH
jgi:hypothetical protein